MGNHSHTRAWGDLAAQADALLGCGLDFWLQSGLGSGLREQLSSALAAARDSECTFYGALAASVDALVRRHAAQQEAYDFLSEYRHRSKATSVFKRVRVPTEADEQVSALNDASKYLSARPQDGATGLTRGRADRLRCALEVALRNVDLGGGALRTAATNHGTAVDALHRIVTNISLHLRARLRSGDPRWLGLALVDGKPRKNICRPHLGASAEEIGTQLGLSFEGEVRSSMEGTHPKARDRRGFPVPTVRRRPRKQLPLDSLKLTSALALLFPPAE